MLELREPSMELAASFEAMRDACIAQGESPWNGRTAIANTDVPAFVRLLQQRAKGEQIPEGWVPETTLWIVEDDETVVGEVEIRHPLNDALRRIGGNIGYLTHPDHRNKGIATFALRAALEHLKTIGATEALITCSEENHASIRVIERCGAKRIGDAALNGAPRRRYRVTLT